MLRRRIAEFSVLLLFTTTAAAFHPDYFPLRVGNQWIYRQVGTGAGEPVIVGIPQADVFDGRSYALMRGLPSGDAWLRMAEDGTVYEYDPDQKREKVWIAFGAPEGQWYFTEITDCNNAAVVESRNASFKSGIGEFTNALHVVYPNAGCADAGITDEFYLPYVGLVERTVTTISGPRTFEMIYARLGGVTFVSAPELTFSLSLNRAVYTTDLTVSRLDNPLLMARLTLRNTRLEPFPLTFPSGQRFDLVLKDEKGNIVYRWSEGKAFTEALVLVQFGPGEENHVVQTPLADRSGAPLPPGNYVAEAWLTDVDPRRFSATVGFEIRNAPREPQSLNRGRH